MNYKITVLPGDGIGPDIVAEALKVLELIGEKFGHSFLFTEADLGGIAIDRHGEPLPQATVDKCKSSDAVLLE